MPQSRTKTQPRHTMDEAGSAKHGAERAFRRSSSHPKPDTYRNSRPAQDVYRNTHSQANDERRKAQPGSQHTSQVASRFGHPIAKRYIASIDGLRAFAVFAVILYHLGLPFARGGLLGVTVFFVISGYLITGLLTAEWEATHTINLPQFWLRRIRRLFPAIVTVIVVMAAVYTFASPLLLTKMRPDIIPGLFWFENWWYILRDLSYFDAVGAPSPLTHFWSLAIEEQFYLVWPIVLLGVYKAGLGKKGVRRACLALAIVSAVAMAVLFDPTGDPSRVYYGTDTRAFSLLIGAWLSFAWPGVQLTEESTRNVSTISIVLLDVVGIAAFTGIVAMCVLVSGFSNFMYYGGLVLCSVLTAIVIAALAHPRSFFARMAGLKPFVWIGQRSYGMYLWHFPIIALMQPRNATAIPWWMYVLEIVIIIAISDLSYRFIETPLRKQGLNALRAAPRSARSTGSHKATFAGWLQTHIPATVLALAITGTALFGIAFVPPVTEGGAEVDAPRVMSATLKKPLIDGVYDVVFIGDSVSLGANKQLNELYPHGLIDTEGNRQFFEGIEDFQNYLNQGVVGDTVVFSLSTNGYAEPNELEQIMQMCGTDRNVWFVNIRVPDDRCQPNNAALQACVDAHDNAYLIDWYSASAGHDEWLIEDGIHLTEEGREAYAKLVGDSIGYIAPTDENTKYDVTFMGDTVALDAADQLAALFPKGVVDCSEGRTIEALKSAFDEYQNLGVVGPEVVFCLGNEERLDRNAVEALIAAVGDERKTWLVNARNAAMWCDENNTILSDTASAHNNVQVIDWHSASQSHDEYLADNGMNLTDIGKEAFAHTVQESMRQY